MRSHARITLKLLVPVVMLCSFPLSGQTVAPPPELTDVPASPRWTQAPTEFRDVPFGGSLEQARTILGPMKCDDFVHSVADAKRCWTTDKKKAFKIKDKVVTTHYFFHHDKFVSVEMSQSTPLMYSFESFQNFYISLREAFEAKFGPPTSGPGLILEWSNDAIRAYIAPRMDKALTRFGDKIDLQLLGTASIETQEWIKAEKAAQAGKVSPF